MVLPHDEAGAGPAVILLHAGVADRTMWREQIGPIAEAGHRAVAVDLPGFGEARIAAGEQAAWFDVIETLDRLSIEQAALVGNSFGGAVALRVALVAPERVSALVLISAPPPDLEPSSELQAAWEAEEEALRRGDVEAAVDAVVDAWTLPDSPQETRDRVAGMQRRAFALQDEANATSEAPDPVERRPQSVARLQIPTLVVSGERDMPDFGSGAEVLAQMPRPNRGAVIEGAGHLAPLEQPEAFRELLLAFLASPL